MRLILHIGTHKTGTSALQECLQQNQVLLAEKGIHYARLGRSTQANGLARLIAKGQTSEAEVFLREHTEKAASAAADTILISGESFYAMTLFFHKFNGRNVKYWAEEAKAISLLKGILPKIPTNVVVFFRRQDQFLESIYQQVVKGTQAVATPISEFASFAKEALNYRRHVQLWRAALPQIHVYSYEQTAGDVVGFFLKTVLKLDNIEQFEGRRERVNVRWDRDLLEYKRGLNALHPSKVDRVLDKLVCAELASAEMDSGKYDEYLTPNERMSLLESAKHGNADLSAVFGMTPFPAISDEELANWRPYPGLSVDAARRLSQAHGRIKRRTSFRVERLALLARAVIQRRLRWLAWTLPIGRWSLRRGRRR